MKLDLITLQREDVEAIENRSKTYANGMQNNDVNQAISVFEENAVRYPPNQPPVEGRENMKNWIMALPKRKVFQTHPIGIVGYNDLAYVNGSYKMVIEADSESVEDNGNYLEIWRKNDDGQWYISLIAHNSNDFALVSFFARYFQLQNQ